MLISKMAENVFKEPIENNYWPTKFKLPNINEILFGISVCNAGKYT